MTIKKGRKTRKNKSISGGTTPEGYYGVRDMLNLIPGKSFIREMIGCPPEYTNCNDKCIVIKFEKKDSIYYLTYAKGSDIHTTDVRYARITKRPKTDKLEGFPLETEFGRPDGNNYLNFFIRADDGVTSTDQYNEENITANEQSAASDEDESTSTTIPPANIKEKTPDELEIEKYMRKQTITFSVLYPKKEIVENVETGVSFWKKTETRTRVIIPRLNFMLLLNPLSPNPPTYTFHHENEFEKYYEMTLRQNGASSNDIKETDHIIIVIRDKGYKEKSEIFDYEIYEKIVNFELKIMIAKKDDSIKHVYINPINIIDKDSSYKNTDANNKFKDREFGIKYASSFPYYTLYWLYGKLAETEEIKKYQREIQYSEYTSPIFDSEIETSGTGHSKAKSVGLDANLKSKIISRKDKNSVMAPPPGMRPLDMGGKRRNSSRKSKTKRRKATRKTKNN
jgi:hypothetical protein